MLKSDSDTSGLIRVDSATPFVLHVIVPLIQEFMQRYPHIEIELNNHDQVIDLLEHKTDVAIRFGELHDSSLHARLLCRSRLYIVASPEYLQQKGSPQSVADLSDHTLLGFSQPTHLNTWPVRLNGEPITVKPKIRAPNGETVRQLALYGWVLPVCHAFWSRTICRRVVYRRYLKIRLSYIIKKFMQSITVRSICLNGYIYLLNFWLRSWLNIYKPIIYKPIIYKYSYKNLP